MASNNSRDDQQYTSKHHDNQLKQDLFQNVLTEPNWEKVVEIHKNNPAAFKTKITSSGHTALHLAISESRKRIVGRLVDIAKCYNNDDVVEDSNNISEAKEILEFANDKGLTPLHVAAATGSMKMCRYIIAVDKSLVLVRDKKGETPLFRAVHYGRKKAFLYLHSVVFEADDRNHDDVDRKYCWRDDDQTILHNAIIRENFDLAFQIIHLYRELVNLVDKGGDTPIHKLARKPAAFASGSSLRGRDKIVYNCISVKELKFKAVEDPTEEAKDKTNLNPSQNKLEHAEKEGAYVDVENHIEGNRSGSDTDQKRQYFLPFSNLKSCFRKLVCTVTPVVLGYRQMSIRKIQKEKKKHVWAVQVLDELLKHATMYDGRERLRASQLQKSVTKNFDDSSDDDQDRSRENSDEEYFDDDISESSKSSEQPICTNVSGQELECSKKERRETAVLLAAKYGIAEMVEKILQKFPVSIYDKDKLSSKNIVLVAVENRNLQVYKLLINKYPRKHVVFQKVDKKDNTALHYAAMYDQDHVKPWPVPGAALQMQWEIKWHEFVENTMPPRLYLRTNKDGETPREMFSHTHKGLVKAGGDWLTSTATSCSVVATLIATVAFASSTTVPGGTDNKTNKPTLGRTPTFELFAIATVAFASSTTVPGGTDNKTNKPTLGRTPTFELFAILSLIALCFSVTSLIMFLAILTSRHQEKDFGKELPRKILLGLTSLFLSIAAMLVTFCAGHFLVFEDNIKYAAFPVYAVTLLPLCLFAAAQFPLYFDLVLATFWSPF
ncbi:Serine/threonine-protein phosphatase 6 regulatory ankyrin repeat subunit A [Morus notabilis]|uniref:Serine/threonine-protein phosphatase 6 regulatory ankyrin repeat subunit A n=1 Tax=Morus notabilis TaxID=981085 RepID=W9REQ9_9ROSA|nr:Serine/threonine-protein phosphatase 6 regulatory ankyrin repeat subunit A [Morus notabilis]